MSINLDLLSRKWIIFDGMNTRYGDDILKKIYLENII